MVLWSGLVGSEKSDSLHFVSFFSVPFCSNWQCLCWYKSHIYSWLLLKWLIKSMSCTNDLFIKWLLRDTLKCSLQSKFSHFLQYGYAENIPNLQLLVTFCFFNFPSSIHFSPSIFYYSHSGGIKPFLQHFA